MHAATLTNGAPSMHCAVRDLQAERTPPTAGAGLQDECQRLEDQVGVLQGKIAAARAHFTVSNNENHRLHHRVAQALREIIECFRKQAAASPLAAASPHVQPVVALPCCPLVTPPAADTPPGSATDCLPSLGHSTSGAPPPPPTHSTRSTESFRAPQPTGSVLGLDVSDGYNGSCM